MIALHVAPRYQQQRATDIVNTIFKTLKPHINLGLELGFFSFFALIC